MKKNKQNKTNRTVREMDRFASTKKNDANHLLCFPSKTQ